MIKTKITLVLCLMLIACEPELFSGANNPSPDISLSVIYKNHGWSYTSYLHQKNKKTEQKLILSGLGVIKSQTDCPSNTDNAILIPRNKTIKIVASSHDIITRICVPQFGINLEAMPGRITEAYLIPHTTGTFCGSCLDENGNINTKSTIVFEVVEK